MPLTPHRPRMRPIVAAGMAFALCVALAVRSSTADVAEWIPADALVVEQLPVRVHFVVVFVLFIVVELVIMVVEQSVERGQPERRQVEPGGPAGTGESGGRTDRSLGQLGSRPAVSRTGARLWVVVVISWLPRTLCAG